MLDPLSFLSIAASLIQFIDFSSKLIAKGTEIYNSINGASTENSELEAITQSLLRQTCKIKNHSDTIKDARGRSVVLAKGDREIKSNCDECIKVSRELLNALDTLRTTGPRSKWRTMRQALSNVWDENKIEALARRLDRQRDQLNLVIVVALQGQIGKVENRNRKELAKIADLEQRTHILLEELKESNRVKPTLLFTEHRQRLMSDQIAWADSHVNVTKPESTELLGPDDPVWTKDTEHPDDHETIDILRRDGNQWAEPLVSNMIRDKHRGVAGENSAADTGLVSDAISKQAIFEWEESLKAALIEQLQFAGMSDRIARIPEAHATTFRWIYITSKPGSEKSTLVKYILKNRRTHDHLRKWAGGSALLSLEFFFWNSGNSMQSSNAGLLQTLLYEGLKKRPELAPVVFSERWRRSLVMGHLTQPWAWSELLDAFKIFNVKTSQDAKLYYMIDGMDELEGDKHQDLVQLVKSLAQIPIFEDAFKQGPNLRLQDLTVGDIAAFISQEFYSNEQFMALSKHGGQYGADPMTEIARKADGVFLWVSLVVRSLPEGITNADRATDLSRRLEMIPSDLNGLYTKILDGLDQFYFEHASQVFQIVRRAEEPVPEDLRAHDLRIHNPGRRYPLTLLDISFADEDIPPAALKSLKRPTNDEKDYRCEAVKRRLNSRCKGLLEVPKFGVSNIQPVTYIHRSFRDYLRKPNVWQRFINASPSFNAITPLVRV